MQKKAHNCLCMCVCVWKLLNLSSWFIQWVSWCISFLLFKLHCPVVSLSPLMLLILLHCVGDFSGDMERNKALKSHAVKEHFEFSHESHIFNFSQTDPCHLLTFLPMLKVFYIFQAWCFHVLKFIAKIAQVSKNAEPSNFRIFCNLWA